MTSNRQYDLILLGPTGYTGRFCAEHIVQNLPTDLKWAIAGRSAHKLEPIAQDLKALNPDRLHPDVLVVQLNSNELNELAQKTRLVINCVGPYHLYSTPVVEACAVNGTHYVDVTGETPWVKSIIEKYHETAKANGAIMIPCSGVESAPADILAWSLVKRVREEVSSATRQINSTIKEMKSSGPSGGTLSTILSTFEAFSMSELSKSMTPFSLVASLPPKNVPGESILEKLFGVRSIRDLGTVTTSPSGICDMTIVHRSSSLMPELYGPHFFFHQFLSVRNALIGVAFHIGFLVAVSLLALPPVRWLVRKFVIAPGAGPNREDSVNDRLEYHAIATADSPSPQRVFGKIAYDGGMYPFTGLLLAEAAMVILNEEEKIKKVSRGGIVTPATLGQDYVDRLEKVGCRIETKVFQY
ncbi:Saccharopine dehydrogenase / Homospermidine synthase [Penicillium cf. griseofulvum]|uniref:Saccharopine dehydrogenase / Homospermidine synthase n=1 Tax=Penicillium cf. griseofulvum TaxID=2972120 RepID=A0A9W9MFS9_9EURO|nr:Saccharopine dehydrogenase / Homospermidine synthase [Penicillium cf. griseofulvum]KAJ5423359.1 Saccharopine dehydrogenase / Homospermidine synthase [Penicillium cf. griseofulvum]